MLDKLNQSSGWSIRNLNEIRNYVEFTGIESKDIYLAMMLISKGYEDLFLAVKNAKVKKAEIDKKMLKMLKAEKAKVEKTAKATV